jgi:hypothetical protein
MRRRKNPKLNFLQRRTNLIGLVIYPGHPPDFLVWLSRLSCHIFNTCKGSVVVVDIARSNVEVDPTRSAHSIGIVWSPCMDLNEMPCPGCQGQCTRQVFACIFSLPSLQSRLARNIRGRQWL